MIRGQLGSFKMEMTAAPQGREGSFDVTVNGTPMTVRFIRDEQGLWLETDRGIFGYDVRALANDDGRVQWTLLGRNHNEHTKPLRFVREGEASQNTNAKKKSVRVKAQMPGKIVRVLVQAGDAVTKGQSVMVMEAMKMENEIKAPEAGTVKEVRVEVGQAVETGAELVVFA